MPRILDFFDGFTSETQPSLGSIEITTNGFQVFGSDAAFETTNGVGIFGDVYANSTTNAVRFFDGTEWVNLGGGGVGYQESLGIGNGLLTDFTLSFIPSTEASILVFANRVMELGTDWNYDDIQNQVEFVAAPASGTDIYVFYLTDGQSISVPAPTGTRIVKYHEVLLAEETAKQFSLAYIPAEPSKTVVDIIGGVPQQYNVGFTISGSVFNWSGYSLDGILSTGDVVRLVYYT